MACEKIVDPVERARQEEAKHMNQADTTPAYIVFSKINKIKNSEIPDGF